MQLPTEAVSNTARNGLFIALGIVTAAFLAVFVRAMRDRAATGEHVAPPRKSLIGFIVGCLAIFGAFYAVRSGMHPTSIYGYWPVFLLAVALLVYMAVALGGIWLVSFIANFWDTLGIGSFATTTSMVRQWNLIPDQRIPGSLNVGYVLPTVAQAYIYTTFVPVDPTTLILMITASVLGAWLGAGVVAQWPRRKIQIGMGLCLLAAATIMTLSQPQVGLIPAGGDALALTGTKLGIGLLGNFLLGALMTLGIGLYAPCMILIYLLGMKPTAAFPIMMGSCAFLMPLASVRFLKAGAYEPKAMLGMVLAGIPAVLIAAFLVKTLPLTAVRWLVVGVVTYTAVNMLRTAARERSAAATRSAGAEAAVAG